MNLRRWQQFDWLLLVTTLLLVLYGVAIIHSATCLGPNCSHQWPPSGFAIRQVGYALIGLLLLLGITLVDYRAYRALAYPLFGVSLSLLVIVLLLGRGHEEYGARRWIPLGFFDFQPSEICKVTMILA